MDNPAKPPLKFPLPGFTPMEIPDLSLWENLISFVPPKEINDLLTPRNMSVQNIDDGYGGINLDNYSVTVFLNPVLNKKTFSSKELLEYFRHNINDFIDTASAFFEPYDEVDKTKWVSKNFYGSVIHIDMRSGAANANPDDGSVVCSQQNENSWIFSTIYAPKDFKHPVSGNREFGFELNDSGKPVFFIRGADRVTRLLDDILGQVIFKSADFLWMSFQNKFIDFVNKNGGKAAINPRNWNRFNWDDVKKKYYKPNK